MLLFSLKPTFSLEEPTPSLEGHQIEIVSEDPLMTKIENISGISNEFYRRLKFDIGEDLSINLGANVTIYPYYAKIKYLLDPSNNFTPYYLISVGFNYIDGEDIAFAKVLDDLSQRMNYGIGVGIEFYHFELEVLYGKYNYQVISVSHEDDMNLYSSTKLTLNCKYRF